MEASMQEIYGSVLWKILNRGKKGSVKKATLASFQMAEKKKWNKRSEEKIRSSFQNNTAQNTSVLGGERGRKRKKGGGKVEKKGKRRGEK